jgi:hypothetical protein
MVIAGRDGSLSWLTSLQAPGAGAGDPGGALTSVTASVPGLVDEASLLFSTPVGMGAVVCRYEYMGSTQQAQPFFAPPAGARAADKGPAAPDPAAVIARRTSYKIESMGSSRSESRKVAVNLVGYPGASPGARGGAGAGAGAGQQNDSANNILQVSTLPFVCCSNPSCINKL